MFRTMERLSRFQTLRYSPVSLGRRRLGATRCLRVRHGTRKTGCIFHFRWTNLWIGGRPDVRVLCCAHCRSRIDPKMARPEKNTPNITPWESAISPRPWPAPPKPSPEVQAIIDGIKAGQGTQRGPQRRGPQHMRMKGPYFQPPSSNQNCQALTEPAACAALAHWRIPASACLTLPNLSVSK